MPAVFDPVEVVVVGGGQAGLSISYELTWAGIEHMALERGQVGHTWLSRWEGSAWSFPNLTIKLPGGGLPGRRPRAVHAS
jgi:putative flavoprotein involved in K+ transport